MQSSVTRSRTSITKSLPASFKLSIFVLYSESYIKVLGFVKGNTLFCQTKHATASAFTFFRHIMKKAVTSQLLPHLERKHTFLSVMNYQKEFY